MNFSSVDNNVSFSDVKLAKHKFDQVLVELGVRNNNPHVGSGMGGNNFQLLVLMSMQHNLEQQFVKPFVFDEKTKVMSWGASWLKKNSIETIRTALNKWFSKLNEQMKYQGLLYTTIVQHSNLRQAIQEHQEHFPVLMECLNGNYFSYSNKLSSLEQLFQAYIMCQELAFQLDKGDTSLVSSVGAALDNFAPETILMAVRQFINIERLVKHNLDEDPVFAKLIYKINKLFD